jgi:hypothetical protein
MGEYSKSRRQLKNMAANRVATMTMTTTDQVLLDTKEWTEISRIRTK